MFPTRIVLEVFHLERMSWTWALKQPKLSTIHRKNNPLGNDSKAGANPQYEVHYDCGYVDPRIIGEHVTDEYSIISR